TLTHPSCFYTLPSHMHPLSFTTRRSSDLDHAVSDCEETTDAMGTNDEPLRELRAGQRSVDRGLAAFGSKTAIDTPLTGSEFAEWFIIGSHCISCLFAVTDGVVEIGRASCSEREWMHV